MKLRIPIHDPRRQKLAKLCLLEARGSKLGAQGFTLLELIVVITIMLILLGIAVPMYKKPRHRSKT